MVSGRRLRVPPATLLSKRAEMMHFLMKRCTHSVATGNYALAGDYAVRAVNTSTAEDATLKVAAAVARRIGHDELAEKCNAMLRRPGRRTPTILREAMSDLLPAMNKIVSDIEKEVSRGSTAASSSARGGVETLVVEGGQHVGRADKSTMPLKEYIADAVGGKAELRSGVDGRGLYCTQRFCRGEVLWTEAPVAVQATPPASSSEPGREQQPSYCSQCLKQLTTTPSTLDGIRCPQCVSNVERLGETIAAGTPSTVSPMAQEERDALTSSMESFCSTSCLEAALSTSHLPQCCNATYATWYAQRVTALELEGTVKEAGESDGSKVKTRKGFKLEGRANPGYRAASACCMLGKLCSIATRQSTHPLALDVLPALSGQVEYDVQQTFDHIGAQVVHLGLAFRQTHFYLEDYLKLYTVLCSNIVQLDHGFALYRAAPFLNHSCQPNVVFKFDTNSAATLRCVVARDVTAGEQLLVDYWGCAPSVFGKAGSAGLPFKIRQELQAQRTFACKCGLCLQRR